MTYGTALLKLSFKLFLYLIQLKVLDDVKNVASFRGSCKTPAHVKKAPSPSPTPPSMCSRVEISGRCMAGKLIQNHRFIHALKFCNCLFIVGQRFHIYLYFFI